MKNEKAAHSLLQHFINKNRMGGVSPAQVIHYHKVLGWAMVMLPLTLISAAVEAFTVLCVVTIESHGHADTILLRNGLILFTLCGCSAFCLLTLRDSYCTLWACRKFRKARKAFKKVFGVDVLKCENAEELRWTVVLRLNSKVETIKGMDESPLKRSLNQILREWYDIGTEFVPVPTYTKLFAN